MFSVKLPSIVTDFEVAFRNDVYHIIVNRSELVGRLLFTVDRDTGSVTKGVDLEDDVDVYEMDFDLTKTLITIYVSDDSIAVRLS